MTDADHEHARTAPATARTGARAQDLRGPPFPALDDELVRRLDVPGPRYTSYPTVPEWREAFGPDDYAGALASATDPLSLYVHIPFCREMCTYCGCNVVVTRDPRRADAYLDTLERELALLQARLGGRRALARVHLGGGTPTSLDERQLERLARAILATFDLRPDAEMALEIDPVVTRPSQLALLRSYGWNRLSMGVQDFDPAVQQAVRRVQSVAETRAMMDAARALGYRSVNLDLIYGLPLQTPATWARTLDEVVGLAPDRIAVFSFAHVPALKPHQRRLPVAALPAPRAKLALFRLAHEAFVAAGFRAIGMDHFARPDDELARALDERRLWRDFQGYTTRRAADTVGVGMSGIASLTHAYAQNWKTLREWHEAIAAGRLPVERGLRLSDDDRRRRDVITQLMCNAWVDLGADGAAHFAPELAALAPLARDGLVQVAGAEVALTPLGRLFVRNVAMVFDAYLGRARDPAPPRFSRTV